MSWIQQLEEEQYDNQTEWLDVMRAEAFDPYADERAYYCEEHDYEDYENECPHGHTEPEDVYIPDLQSEYNLPF